MSCSVHALSFQVLVDKPDEIQLVPDHLAPPPPPVVSRDVVPDYFKEN